VNEGPEQIAEAIKDSSLRQEIRADPHLTGDAKKDTISVLVENDQLLNATGCLVLLRAPSG